MINISDVDISKLPKTVDSLLAAIKQTKVKIPINKVLPIRYAPMGSWANILVVSEDFIGELGKEGDMVYVEASSQHGQLNLFDVTKEPKGITLPWHKVDAYYDRDPATRKINNIYLDASDSLRVAFCGTLDELMQHPHVTERK